MTKNKAIEVLQDIIHYVEPGDPPEEHQAAQLGIEALELVNALTLLNDRPFSTRLPSETDD